MKPRCDYCGKQFGNEGALATHQGACEENPANAPQQAQQAQPQRIERAPPADGQGNLPANQPQGQGGQQGGLPANQSEAELAQQGAQAADIVTNLNADDPSQRASAKEQMAEGAAGFVYKMLQNSAAKDREQAQNIQKARENSNVERSEPDYCPECGQEILNPPPGQFYCPGCSTVLEADVEEPDPTDQQGPAPAQPPQQQHDNGRAREPERRETKFRGPSEDV